LGISVGSTVFGVIVAAIYNKVPEKITSVAAFGFAFWIFANEALNITWVISDLYSWGQATQSVLFYVFTFMFYAGGCVVAWFLME
jgi:hypothetical protein